MQQVYGVDHVNQIFFKEATLKKQEIIDNYKSNGGTVDKNGHNDDGSVLYEHFFYNGKF